MQLIVVNAKDTEKKFIEVAVQLYANDSKWIRPLDKDINDVFDQNKNKAYRFGETIRWILLDDTGKLIGRIAAFVNKKYKNKGDDVAAGGMGFFECINQQDAANLLLDTAKNWLLEKGMQSMDGPINFGERDRWWGLVTAGFDEPLYCMNYNPPYYVELLKNYGFLPFYNQLCYSLDPKKPLQAKIHDRHAQYLDKPGFCTKHFEKNKVEKYAQDFVTVYNKAWAGHGGMKELSKEQALILFKKMLPIMNPKLVWFAYYEDAPIAMFVNLPDLNQWFKYLNGKFSIFHQLYFLMLKTFVSNKKFNGLVFGVVPEWQGKGIDAYIIGESARKYFQTNNCPYTQYEMQWIGDFNPKMINIVEGLGETFQSRQLTTFRYLFDRNKRFVRHPMIQ
ncbi:MAG: hypothetical protein RLY16_2850 [Bacteroidota bacterium]|jgi:hypothetical protein